MKNSKSKSQGYLSLFVLF